MDPEKEAKARRGGKKGGPAGGMRKERICMKDKIRILQQWIDDSRSIVFFGGAGVSTESGMPEFRSVDGLYHQSYDYPPEEILSRSFFDVRPGECYRFDRDKMLCLDAKGKLLGSGEIGRGGIESSDVDVRKIAEEAFRHNAVRVILAHNHPSGVALPSEQDEKTTRELSYALRLLHINLLDHIIVADRDWVSLADSGML